MSNLLQETCSSDSPTLKAKSRPMNLVSHQCLSKRQNSEHMSVSGRTEGVSASFWKPVQTNTSNSSMLCSQVRSQGNAVDLEHPEQGSAPASFGILEAGRFGFSGQGGKNEMDSQHSGRVTDSAAVGNRVHVTQEEEQTCFEFQNTKITNSEYLQKVFRNVTNTLRNNEGVSQMTMEADKTNSMWTLFMASSMRAALLMYPSYTELGSIQEF